MAPVATYINLKPIEKENQSSKHSDTILNSIREIKNLIYCILLIYCVVALNLIYINFIHLKFMLNDGTKPIFPTSDVL